MKKIYLMLTRSSTPISLAIRLLSQARYTHSSLSLSSTLTPMYSIGRRFTFLNWPAHIKQEPLDSGFYWWHRWARVGIYSLEVSEEGLEKIRKYIEEKWEERIQFAYRGMADCRAGRLKIYEGRMFCSQFVANALKASGEIALERDPALTQPADFPEIPGIREVYTGRIRDLAALLREKGTVE